MKSKNLLMQFLIVFALLFAMAGGYSLGILFPGDGIASLPGVPPLSNPNLPSQTVNGITATIESYYADASRLVFTVRVEGESKPYFLDQISIRKNLNEEINAGYGVSPIRNDLAFFLIDFLVENPLVGDQLNGSLSFTVVSPEDANVSSDFQHNYPFLGYFQRLCVNGVPWRIKYVRELTG